MKNWKEEKKQSGKKFTVDVVELVPTPPSIFMPRWNHTERTHPRYFQTLTTLSVENKPRQIVPRTGSANIIVPRRHTELCDHPSPHHHPPPRIFFLCAGGESHPKLAATRHHEKGLLLLTAVDTAWLVPVGRGRGIKGRLRMFFRSDCLPDVRSKYKSRAWK